MAFYKVYLKPSIKKDLRRLPKELIPKLLEKIERLSEEPLPKQAVKLKGSERHYRIRAGEYRVIYEVNQEAQRVLIQYIRHRREVYRSLSGRNR